MNMRLCGLLAITAVSLRFMACLAASQVSPSPSPSGSAVLSARPASGAATEQDRFHQAVTAAKKEGMLVAVSALASGPRQDVAEAFREKYGIDMDWVTGKGSETVVKIEAERRAGIYTNDIILAGVSTQTLLKERGFLDPMDSLLVLPEVKDTKQWKFGKLPFVDRDQMMISYFAHAASSVVINTSLVKAEEIKSYRDLLSPRWKGKIIMHDPTVSGAGSAFFAINILGIMGKEFAYQLAQQEPLIVRDPRLALEWVARGKYPIVLAPDTSLLGELSKAGAPLKHIVPEEGTFTSGGSGGLALFNKAAHPNAAVVFVNWFLTREGQTLVARAQPDQSKRLDVPTSFIDVDRQLDPNVKYTDGDAEEFITGRFKAMEIAREIFHIQ